MVTVLEAFTEDQNSVTSTQLPATPVQIALMPSSALSAHTNVHTYTYFFFPQKELGANLQSHNESRGSESYYLYISKERLRLYKFIVLFMGSYDYRLQLYPRSTPTNSFSCHQTRQMRSQLMRLYTSMRKKYQVMELFLNLSSADYLPHLYLLFPLGLTEELPILRALHCALPPMPCAPQAFVSMFMWIPVHHTCLPQILPNNLPTH